MYEGCSVQTLYRPSDFSDSITAFCVFKCILLLKNDQIPGRLHAKSRYVAVSYKNKLETFQQVEVLSYDHKPNNEEELRRITAGGGWVQLNRVNGNLALSRALGDYVFKRNYRLSPQEQIVTGNRFAHPAGAKWFYLVTAKNALLRCTEGYIFLVIFYKRNICILCFCFAIFNIHVNEMRSSKQNV